MWAKVSQCQSKLLRASGQMVLRLEAFIAGSVSVTLYKSTDSTHLSSVTVTSHNHVRESAGLFDVSHMIQQTFTGPSSLLFLSSLVPSSLTTLPPWSSTLSVLLNKQGGIIDDLLVGKEEGDESWYVVTNAGRAKEDGEWIGERLKEWNETEGKGKGKEVKWKRLDGYGLIALQGE